MAVWRLSQNPIELQTVLANRSRPDSCQRFYRLYTADSLCLVQIQAMIAGSTWLVHVFSALKAGRVDRQLRPVLILCTEDQR
jgi:hypothetical protein